MKKEMHTEKEVFEFYEEIISKDSKPEDMSHSLYITCVAIQVHEHLGNNFPTQFEIDLVEAHLKRFIRRSSLLKKAA